MCIPRRKPPQYLQSDWLERLTWRSLPNCGEVILFRNINRGFISGGYSFGGFSGGTVISRVLYIRHSYIPTKFRAWGRTHAAHGVEEIKTPGKRAVKTELSFKTGSIDITLDMDFFITFIVQEQQRKPVILYTYFCRKSLLTWTRRTRKYRQMLWSPLPKLHWPQVTVSL